MTYKKLLKRMLAVGVIQGLSSATSNSMGAAILDSAGHEGHNSTESGLLAATGAFILGATFELITASITNPLDVNRNQSNTLRIFNDIGYIYPFIQLLAPLVGRGVFENSGYAHMSLRNYEEDAAVGGVLFSVPYYMFMCCGYNIVYFNNNYFSSLEFLIRLVAGTTISASLSSIFNAVGASILTQAGYEDHTASESAIIALVGSSAVSLAFTLSISIHCRYRGDHFDLSDIGHIGVDVCIRLIFTVLLGPVVGKLILSSLFSGSSFSSYETDSVVGFSVMLIPFIYLMYWFFNLPIVGLLTPKAILDSPKPKKLPTSLSFEDRLTNIGMSDDIPEPYKCAVSLCVMNQPQQLNCGHSFDECSIRSIESCPVCRKPKTSAINNYNLKSAIELYVAHKEKKYKTTTEQPAHEENEEEKCCVNIYTPPKTNEGQCQSIHFHSIEISELDEEISNTYYYHDRLFSVRASQTEHRYKNEPYLNTQITDEAKRNGI